MPTPTVNILIIPASTALIAATPLTSGLSKAGEGAAHAEAHQHAVLRAIEPAVLDALRIRMVEVSQPQSRHAAIYSSTTDLSKGEITPSKNDKLAGDYTVNAGYAASDRSVAVPSVQLAGYAKYCGGSNVDHLELDRASREVEAGSTDGQATTNLAMLRSRVKEGRRGGEDANNHDADADQHRTDPLSRITHLDPLLMLALAATIIVEASLLVLAIWFVLVMAESASIVLVVLSVAISGAILFAGAMLGLTLLRIA